jgi:hypothetical protein
MRTSVIVLIVALLSVVQSFAGVATFDRQYTGGHPSLPMNWEQSQNWDSTKVPGLLSRVHIAFAAPYVAVTGTLCESFTLTVQTGGKLALRRTEAAKFLVVVNDLTVHAGGAWTKEGPDGTAGPIVVIGGDIRNSGTIDLKGVNTAQEQVILAGCNQRLSGSADMTFQTLRSFLKFTVDGVTVYVTGKYYGPWPTLVNGGQFIVGEAPLPITLASFSAVRAENNAGVTLQWRTITEVDNYGFHIERRAADAETYQQVDFVPTQGNGIVPHEYAYTDAAVANGTWYYRLRQVDLNGDESTTEDVRVEVAGVTGVTGEAIPQAFGVQQNYPNPFNPETAIRFSVATAGTATLVVYDAIGREVATLFDGVAEPGMVYSVRFDGAGLSSGMYFYRLTAGAQVDMKRMVLAR